MMMLCNHDMVMKQENPDVLLLRRGKITCSCSHYFLIDGRQAMDYSHGESSEGSHLFAKRRADGQDVQTQSSKEAFQDLGLFEVKMGAERSGMIVVKMT